MELRKSAQKALTWTTVTAVSLGVIQAAQFFILSRYLEPSDFGLMAMVSICLSLGQLFENLGLSEALIQRQNPSQDERSSLFWMNIIGGLTTCLLLWLTSPLIGIIFNAPLLAKLLSVAALGFLVTPLGNQFLSLLKKDLDFKPIAFVQVASALTGLGVSIACVIDGIGVWSLVWGYLAIVILQAGLLFFLAAKSNLLPSWHFALSDLRGYMRYGIYFAGGSLANFFNSRLDQILVGGLLGTSALGYYSVALRLLVLPMDKLLPPLTNTTFPLFAKLRDDRAQLQAAYFEFIFMILSILAPLMFMIASLAPELVNVLIGPKWAPAVPLVRILLGFVLLRTLVSVGGVLMLAVARTEWIFYWNTALLVFLPLVGWASSLTNSAQIIAASLGLAYVPLLIVHYRLILSRILGPCLPSYARVLIKTFGAALLCSAGCLAAQFFTRNLDLNVAFTVEITVGAILYALCLFSFYSSRLSPLRGGLAEGVTRAPTDSHKPQKRES